MPRSIAKTRLDRDGAFVAADGGTLLLDEIGDAPARVQVALLRALETRSVKPVGSDAERSVDVRVLAATSRDVDAMMAAGDFRRDLYYRLAEASVELPPLRDRPEDIPALASTSSTRSPPPWGEQRMPSRSATDPQAVQCVPRGPPHASLLLDADSLRDRPQWVLGV